jgi:hypothetical protein
MNAAARARPHLLRADTLTAMDSNPNVHLEMTPFSRLALVQAASIAADTCMNVALAGSIFFSLQPGEARPRVIAYLVLTFLPFTLLSPLIGPALDRSRGGRRLVVAGCAAGRAILMLILSLYITAPSPQGYLVFPLAFGALVFSKGHNVAKSSLVPAVVTAQQSFVKANSRLAIVSVIAGIVGAIPAAIFYKLLGAEASLYVGAVFALAGTALAFRIPKAPVVAPALSEAAEEELHARSIVLSGTLMAFIRGGVGFLTLLIAFSLKSADDSLYWYAIAGGAAGIGNGIGIVSAPALRKRFREEWIMAGSAVIAGVLALLSARGGTFWQLCFIAFINAIAAAVSRLSFDSLVQRDAPDAARGRVFARYETRFQAAWVIGALLPVVITMSNRFGLFILAAIMIFAGVSYIAGTRSMRDPSRGVDSSHGFLGLAVPEPGTVREPEAESEPSPGSDQRPKPPARD